MRSAPTVDIALGQSVRGVAALSVLHAAALILLMLAMPDGPGMAVAALGVAASWLYARRHPALGFGSRAPRRLLWREDGSWQLAFADDALQPAELLPMSVVRGPVPVLRFRVGGRRVARVLLGDEADAEPLQRLRMRLATEAHDAERAR
jgi:type IV secretory pathway TrbD component